MKQSASPEAKPWWLKTGTAQNAPKLKTRAFRCLHAKNTPAEPIIVPECRCEGFALTERTGSARGEQMDGRTIKMTFEERREAVIDVMAQAVLGLALARLGRGSNDVNLPKTLRSKELAMSVEQRLYVYESAGGGRRREEPDLMEVRP